MTGGTLAVSRAVNLYDHFKKKLEEVGFKDVTVTGNDKDGLNMLIREMNPRIVLIEAKFYECCTPYMITDLHKIFPKLNIAAVSMSDFPDDLAMYFIINGARSYVSLWDGVEQFYKGLNLICHGNVFVSPNVMNRIELRNMYPDPSGTLTKRQLEVLRLVANGFTGEEISDTLHISERVVENSKSEIYTALNVRNAVEAVRVSESMGIIKKEELNFFGRNYVLKPLPKKQNKKIEMRMAV